MFSKRKGAKQLISESITLVVQDPGLIYRELLAVAFFHNPIGQWKWRLATLSHDAVLSAPPSWK